MNAVCLKHIYLMFIAADGATAAATGLKKFKIFPLR